MRRATCFLAVLVVAAVLWFAPWPDAGLQPFTIHMLRHIAMIAVIAPLLVFAYPLGEVRISPLLTSVVEFVVVWGWHLPWPHAVAAVSPLALALEQASYLGSGFLLWSSVLRGVSPLAGAGGMLLTSMHMTLLGALLILAQRPLYETFCFGAEPLADQRIGGMLMLTIGTVVYLVAGLWLVSRILATATGEERSGA